MAFGVVAAALLDGDGEGVPQQFLADAEALRWAGYTPRRPRDEEKLTELPFSAKDRSPPRSGHVRITVSAREMHMPWLLKFRRSISGHSPAPRWIELLAEADPRYRELLAALQTEPTELDEPTQERDECPNDRWRGQ